MMNGVSRRRLLTLSLLALLLLVSLLLRLGLVGAPSYDFRPVPDASEYAASGLSLAEGRCNTLIMGGGVYPSRYPAGYPILLALFHLLGLPVERFYLGSILLSLAMVSLVYLLARKTGSGRDASLVAAAVAACSPVLLFCSIRVLAENVSLVVFLAAFLLALNTGAAARSRASVLILLAGLAAGYAVTIRLANAVSLPVVFGLILWAGWRTGPNLRNLLRRSVLFGAGTLIGLLPQLALNRINFGTPWATGYGYWNQVYQDPLAMFEVAHVVHPWNPLYGNLWYYLQHLAGMSFEATFLRLYSLAAVVLTLVGLFAVLRQGRRRAIHIFGLLHCLVTLSLLLFYFGQSTRLLAPVIPWVALWAGEGFSALWHRPGDAVLRRSCRGAGLLLVILALVPLTLWAASRNRTFGGAREPSLTAASITLAHTPPGALIVSNISPVYTGLLIDYRGGREVVQLSREDGTYVSYLLNAAFRGEGPPLPQARFMPPLPGREPFQPLAHGPEELDSWRLQQVAEALRTGRPVFILQTVERPPFSDGHLAVERFFRVREVQRLPRVWLVRVEGIREGAEDALARTPLDLKNRRRNRPGREGSM
jgi:4-amino-4-deoxy-L-arabinose transferase-like glycosyltransferase